MKIVFSNNEEKKIKDIVLKGNFEKVILIYQNQTGLFYMFKLVFLKLKKAI